ncbi:MAG: UDP-N-acetylmuramoyl-tripeptide--D-alanyl-D-alanine ligase [Actinomycetes bacterium]
MIPMSMADIAAAVDGALRDVDASIQVRDVVVDSRQAAPGSVFFALPGSVSDGRLHAPEAIAAGAEAAVVSTPVDGPCLLVDDPLVALGRLAATTLQRSDRPTVVGITGSNGKTTTKDLVAAVLSTVAPTVAAPASYNGEVGLPLSVLRATSDTKYLVLEYGARGVGHIRELTRIARPDIAVELGVGVAHIGEFGSRAAIATAKAELVAALPSEGVAVLNADDPYVLAMQDQTAAQVVTFSRRDDATVRATSVALDQNAQARFVLSAPGGEAEVRLNLYGEHQVTNALATAAVALTCGLSVADTAAALSAAEPRSRWRMEVVETPQGVTLINDAYNANPDSMAAGLHALATIGGTRRTWAVLGQMAELGDVAPEAHRNVGALAAELHIDQVVVVGRAAAAIGDAAGGPSTTVHVVADVEAATALLLANLRPGDVVLVKASRAAGLEHVAVPLIGGAVPA